MALTDWQLKLKAYDKGEETPYFRATLLHKGAAVAEVSNSGTGGCHSYHWRNPALQRLLRAALEGDGRRSLGADFEPHDAVVYHLLESAA